jgi:hypothetical protein
VLLLVLLSLGRYLVYLRVPAPYPSPNPRVEAQIAQRLFAADNDERAARGLPAVTWDEALARQADDWSHTHLPVRGEDPPGVQSNVIGRGGCPTAAPSPCYRTAVLPADGDAHVGWMTSQGHRDNILDPAVTSEGVGVFCGPHGILYATEIFGGAATTTPETTTAPSPVVHATSSGMTCSGQIR